MTPDEWRVIGIQCLALLSFSGLNISLNFYNSWALKDHGPGPHFSFPVFFTMFHMVAGMLGSSVIIAVKPPASGFPSFKQLWHYKTGLVAIAVCTSVNLCCNNISLMIISLFMNQVIKATGPLPTMLFTFLLERKTYGWAMILSCASIVGGTILAVPLSSTGNGVRVDGIVIAMISTVAASLKPVVAGMVMKGTAERPKLAPPVVLFYDSFLSFFFMMAGWLISTERERTISYFEKEGGIAIAVISAGSAMAFCFNLSAYYLVQLTSALTSTIAANGVKVINIVISALQTHLSSVRNWCGVALVCVSLCAYAYASHRAKKAPPKPAGAGLLSGDVVTMGGKGASEKTPLAPGSEEGNSAVCCTIS